MKRPYTLAAVQGATARAAIQLELMVKRAEMVTKDTHRGARLKALECKACFYTAGMRISGRAMTAWNCIRCEAESVYASTDIPTLCRACAEATKLCAHCGGDRGGKKRTKLP